MALARLARRCLAAVGCIVMCAELAGVLTASRASPLSGAGHVARRLEQGYTGDGAPLEHYRTLADNTTYFEPVPECLLPVPQPLNTKITINALKAIVMNMALGINVQKEEVTFNDKAVFWATNIYYFGMVPITLLSMTHKVLFTMGPFDCRWNLFQCYGIALSMGPWLFNGLMLVLLTTTQQSGAYESLIEQSAAAEALQEQKWRYKILLCKATLLPYLLLVFPFLVSNTLIGAIIFCVQLPILYGGWRLFQSGKESAKSIDGDDIDNGFGWIWMNVCSPIIALPLACGANLLSEVIAIQSTYFYQGQGWLDSLYMPWWERSNYLYVGSFVKVVLGHFPWLTSFINEVV